ncbi:MAG: RNA-directed DNA polymerase [Planctomycetes bacterium]|nr:RNA-directed DNA polymerase [Planctomycetota bacterium]
MSFFSKLFSFSGKGFDVAELARRLDLTVDELLKFTPVYREFTIPKRTGGRRTLHAPIPELKGLQRRILRRLLGRLKTHSAATGFQRGESFATNARRHCGKAVVMRMDIRDFFPSITARRVRDYFRAIGWNRPATALLVKLCTWQGALPQGAPTSPRLSNLVNFRLDARLAGLAACHGATYTRYADDLTFSFVEDDHDSVGRLRCTARLILDEEGYRPHPRKFQVRRTHQRQQVTGLVVNSQVNLPRSTRRWLRAVEHRTKHYGTPLSAGSVPLRPVKRPTLTPEELTGWQALRAMISQQGSQD